MKKLILGFILMLFTSTALATSYYTPEIISAMKMYKSKNYTECLQVMHQVLDKDPSNVIAYYYVGLTNAMLGDPTKAKEAYERVIALNVSSQLTKYAKDGIICIDTPENCPTGMNTNPAQRIIGEINYKMEKDKIDTIKNSVNTNRNSSAVPREYVTTLKDFSNPKVQASEKARYKQMERLKNTSPVDNSNTNVDNVPAPKKSEAVNDKPSKEEIADAFDTLKRAGYMNINPMQQQMLATQFSPEMMQMNMLMGMNSHNVDMDFNTMMPYMMGQNQNLSPEMLKNMMMSSMVNNSFGFNK